MNKYRDTKQGDRIKQLRLERGYSLKSLARLVNVVQATIHKWEKTGLPSTVHNKSSAANRILKELAAVFGVNPQYIISGNIITDNSLSHLSDAAHAMKPAKPKANSDDIDVKLSNIERIVQDLQNLRQYSIITVFILQVAALIIHAILIYGA